MLPAQVPELLKRAELVAPEQGPGEPSGDEEDAERRRRWSRHRAVRRYSKYPFTSMTTCTVVVGAWPAKAAISPLALSGMMPLFPRVWPDA